MATVPEVAFREQLTLRRERLRGAAGAGAVAALLAEVDAALARLDAGSFGLCETCHDPIEAERLLADPLQRFCVDHLTRGEQQELQRDLELANRIQRGLLPARDLVREGFELHYAWLPAGPVSGDFCDVIPGRDGSFSFLLADVSGKGVAASILMGHVHALFRSFAELGLGLGDSLERANRILCEATLPGSYATLVAGRAEAGGRVELFSAGHLAPLLLSARGVAAVEGNGLPLGLFCNARFEPVSVTLAPGDVLLLYSDGLSEARGPADEEYGGARIAEVLAGAGGVAAEGVVRACVEDVLRFTAGRAPGDDLTLMAVRRRPVS